jgi:hypothetical protein
MVAMLTGVFLTLAGFYVINDTIKRDEETRVGQIIATTPLRNSLYTMGTTLANFAVLSTMTAIVFMTAIGMQIFRGEDTAINLWKLIAPFLVLVLPPMLLVAAIAVLFETRPSLRRGAGNIAYAFIWMIGLPLISDTYDLFGINAIISSMGSAGLARYPDLYQNSFIMGFTWGFPHGQTPATFTWQGIPWTSEIIQTRLLLIFVALGIAVLSSVRFNRFDPAREPRKTTEAPPPDILDAEDSISQVAPLREIQLRPLDARALRFSFGPMLLAETRLILKDLNGMPFLGRGGSAAALALIFAGVLLPLSEARGLLLPLAWVLPVLTWSKMGTREERYGTDKLVFSSANSLKRQLPSAWMAGVLLAMATGIGVALNSALYSDLPGLLAWTVGALFIPSLALFLGVWTGSSKGFEFIYVMLWYIGPMNRAIPLDFMGALPESVAAGIWQYYLVITFILLGLSFIGRLWQIQRG